MTQRKKSKPANVRSKRNKIASPTPKRMLLPQGPLHPWRPCPVGQHRVREYTKSDGTTHVRSHCRNNPTHKDQLYPEEMGQMAQDFFSSVETLPQSDTLGFDDPGARGDAYDDLIGGWTQYWNDILHPDDPLDPDLVKALIASESGFNPNTDNKKKGSGRARGLLQITDGTRKILQDEKGELKDHFLTLSDKEVYDPNLNIGGGIRWLFHKKAATERRLRRPISWREAIVEYKGYRSNPNGKGMGVFDDYYNRLKSKT